MNEANISPRIGIAMLNIFFVLGIICYMLMGSYDQALAVANGSSNSSSGSSSSSSGSSGSSSSSSSSRNAVVTTTTTTT
jgi:hypothetical protein